MAKRSATALSLRESKLKRKGVHSKCKNSSHKSGKNYVKKYRGQGR